MIKYLIILFALILSGCSTPGIRPMKKSELSGKTAAPVEKNITVVLPKKTNSYVFEVVNDKPTVVAYVETKSPKEPLKTEKRVVFDVVTEPSTNTIKIDEPKHETISTNFLIFWYGTLVLAVVTYFLLKSKKQKPTKIIDLSSDI